MHLRSFDISDLASGPQQAIRFHDAMGRVHPITVITGPNGSGKTSILRAIYRSLSDSSNSIRFIQGGRSDNHYQVFAALNSIASSPSVERVLSDFFHRICAPKRYAGCVRSVFDLDTIRPLFSQDGNFYLFKEASAGEQVILNYLTQLLHPEPINNSLILIDDPELHLNPRWLRQLYHALPLIGNNNQFILATHSPELCQLAAEDNALIDLTSFNNVVW